MKIMFTGATGVLGKASVPLLVADGHDVTGVFRSDLEKRWLEAVGARPARVDLFDPAATSQAMSGMDTVIHFATAIPPQRSMRKRSLLSMQMAVTTGWTSRHASNRSGTFLTLRSPPSLTSNDSAQPVGLV
jgi:nucleoside-diphosphate-sugar epimerase